jgi:pimeloyl-ACP methyl ester carboxylesterase
MLLLGIGLFFAYVYLCFQLANSVISPVRFRPTMPASFQEREIAPGNPAWVSPDLDKRDQVFVFSHGLGGSRDFFASTATELQKRGYGVVLLAMPGQDSHPAKTIGFGTTESQVIRATLDKLTAKRIVLVGCSMGGAATWMASDHPKVDAIATEGAYGRLDPVTKVWLRAKAPSGDILFAPVIWIATSRLRIKASEINPVDYAKRWDHAKPALVIQSANDDLIPREQADELAKASGAEYWVVEGTSHANAQGVGAEYVGRLEALMKQRKD